MIWINFCPVCGSPQHVHQRSSGSSYGQGGDGNKHEGYELHKYCEECHVNFDIKVDIRTRKKNDTSHYMGSYSIPDENEYNEYREFFKNKFDVYPEEGSFMVYEKRYIPTYLYLMKQRELQPDNENLKIILFGEYQDSIKKQ